MYAAANSHQYIQSNCPPQCHSQCHFEILTNFPYPAPPCRNKTTAMEQAQAMDRPRRWIGPGNESDLVYTIDPFCRAEPSLADSSAALLLPALLPRRSFRPLPCYHVFSRPVPAQFYQPLFPALFSQPVFPALLSQPCSPSLFSQPVFPSPVFPACFPSPVFPALFSQNVFPAMCTQPCFPSPVFPAMCTQP
jgi:hypothetical protein